MYSFKDFKKDVMSLGGVWASDDVYFSNTWDEYSASYKPSYPESDRKDMTLSYIGMSAARLNGNFELIAIFDKENDYHAHHYEKIEECEIR